MTDMVMGIWLGVLAVEDWRVKYISLKGCVIGSIISILLLACMITTWEELLVHAIGSIFGGMFLLLSKCTKESLGYGDGIVLLIMGTYLGAWVFIETTLVAFAGCAIQGIWEMGKRGKKELIKSEVPFIPWLLLGYMVICAQGETMKYKGSATIELVYIMPVIFLVFMVAVNLSFFFHDKNVLQGLTYEAVLIGSSQYRRYGTVQEEEIYEFLQENAEEKLLYFPIPEIEISVAEDMIIIGTTTDKNQMHIEVEKIFPLSVPEVGIRNINIIEGAINGSN